MTCVNRGRCSVAACPHAIGCPSAQGAQGPNYRPVRHDDDDADLPLLPVPAYPLADAAGDRDRLPPAVETPLLTAVLAPEPAGVRRVVGKACEHTGRH